MERPKLIWTANFIRGIADLPRERCARGEHRDEIPPMSVLRRIGTVPEPPRQAVLRKKASLDAPEITNQDQALRPALGQAFHNTSTFTLRDLRARVSPQHPKANFEVVGAACLDRISPSAKKLVANFAFRDRSTRPSGWTISAGWLLDEIIRGNI